MKRINILIMILAMTGFMCQAFIYSSDSFTVKLNIDGLKDGEKVFLITLDEGKPLDRSNFPLSDTVAEIAVKNGVAQLKSSASHYGKLYYLSLSSKERRGVFLLVANGENILVNGRLENWPDVEIIGSKGTADWYGYKSKFDPLSVAKKTAEMKELRRQFLINNPNSVYAPYVILRNTDMSFAEKRVFYDKLTSYAKASCFGIKLGYALDSKIDWIGAIKTGVLAPSFTSRTIDGKEVSLTEVVSKNRLTLVDFWGSWCKPCRKEIPNLKRVYQAFHNKGFEILGVAFEFKKEDWEKALKEENMPWPQVSQLKGRDEDASRLYGVNGVPASLLIDGEGKIVAMDLPGSKIPSAGGSLRSEALYKKIEEILDKGY